MREVDHAHHAEDDRQPERRKHQEREGIRELIEERVRPRPGTSSAHASRHVNDGPARARRPRADACDLYFLGRLLGVYWL